MFTESRGTGLPRLTSIAMLAFSILHGSPGLMRGAAQGTPGVNRVAIQQQTDSVGPGVVVRREFSTRGMHVYSAMLRSGDYLGVRMESFGIDASVTIYAPNGVKLAESSYRSQGPKWLAVISNVSGDHRVEVRALDTTLVTGQYKLEITDIRAAEPRDSDRVVASRLVAEAESLRARLGVQLARRAILKYQQALRLWTSVGDVDGGIHVLRLLGDAYEGLGNAQAALHYYELSWERSKQAKYAEEENDALNNLSRLYLYIGHPDEASKYGRLALELSRRIRNKRGEAEALRNIGNVKQLFGDDPRECLVIHNGALAAAKESGDRRIQAKTLLEIGYAYSDLRDTKSALESFDRALSLWMALEDRRGRATTLNALGQLYGNVGEKQRALGYHRQAKEIFSTLGDLYGAGVAFGGMAFQYLELGDVYTALEYFQKQLRLHRKAQHRDGEAGALLFIGRCFSLLGNHRKSLEYYMQSLAMNQELQHRRMEAYLLGLVGTSYEALGENEKALQYYERSLLLSQASSDPRETSYAFNRVARMLHKNGRDREALSDLQSALALSRQANDRFGESLTLSNTAEVEAERGNNDLALSEITESLQISESLRTSVMSYELRASYFASVRRQNELEVEVLMRLHAREPHRGFDRLALEASERARARSLLDNLNEAGVNIRRGVDPELLSREHSLKQKLESKTERLASLMGGGTKKGEAAALEQEIRDLTAQYDEIQSEIRSTSPQYAALTQASTLSVTDIQEQVLEGETLLLEYSLGEKRSYLWAVSRGELTCHDLGPRAQIEDSARMVIALLTARQLPSETVKDYRRRVMKADADYWKAAARLSELVLEPVGEKLTGKRLVIVSDGALQYVPFGALPVPRTGRSKILENAAGEKHNRRSLGGDFRRKETTADFAEPSLSEDPVPMVIKHEIVNLPSASALAFLRKLGGNRRLSTNSVAVLADPVFDLDDPRVQVTKGVGARKPASAEQESSEPSGDVHLLLRALGLPKEGKSIPRLVSTRQEAEAILAAAPRGTSFIATGFDASRATAMRADLGRYRIVHFATHAVLNSDNPGLSGIILSMVDEKAERQNGFLGLHEIYDLQLPVDLVVLSACNSALGKDMGGEGLVGIVRGFMHAGASRVVASLWKVDDLATKELMARFYRNIFERGKSPSAALRSAQIEMFRHTDWNPPYYWAGFVLEGEWR
jgi:CHAT domain-containing protein